jgi:hypothetical protein
MARRAQAGQKGHSAYSALARSIPELLGPSCFGVACQKSGLESHVPARNTRGGSSLTMDQALDAYIAWLEGSWSNTSPREEQPGASLLAVVAHLCREFPGTSPIMSELLVAHVQVTTVLYEVQLHAIRRGSPSQAVDDPLFAPFVRKQIERIGRMRHACRGRRTSEAE